MHVGVGEGEMSVHNLPVCWEHTSDVWTRLSGPSISGDIHSEKS